MDVCRAIVLDISLFILDALCGSSMAACSVARWGAVLGLPREGLPADRARRLYGAEIRPQVVGRRAMVSDDTEHLPLTAGALVGAGAGPEGLPDEWVAGLREWPRDVAWMM